MSARSTRIALFVTPSWSGRVFETVNISEVKMLGGVFYIYLALSHERVAGHKAPLNGADDVNI